MEPEKGEKKNSKRKITKYIQHLNNPEGNKGIFKNISTKTQNKSKHMHKNQNKGAAQSNKLPKCTQECMPGELQLERVHLHCSS